MLLGANFVKSLKCLCMDASYIFWRERERRSWWPHSCHHKTRRL